MLANLVKTTTSDGLLLDGSLHIAADDDVPALPVDAVVCLHGVGSNFYGSTLIEAVTGELLDMGISVLRANTRGHDLVHNAATSQGARRQGAAYEVVDECRYDVATWADLLVQRGYRRIGLLGHSLGAIKCLYSQAYAPHPAIAAIAALSPPRLSYTAFQTSPQNPNFGEALTNARRHVEAGRGETLIEVRFPFPLLITAAGYLDKYGPEERYNILKFAGRVACPTLFTYGQRELDTGGVAFAGVPEALASLPPQGQQFRFSTIPQADHMYTGVREQLTTEIARWMVALQP